MSPEHALTHAVLGIAFISWLWFRKVAALRRDTFRSDIRRIRDRLFDFVWQGGHDFNDPAYIEARQALNGLLRWSNSLSPITFVMSVYFAKTSSVSLSLRQSRSDAMQKAIDGILELVVKRTMAFVFLEGTWGLFIKVFVLLPAILFSRWKQLKQKSVNAGTALLVEAVPLGGPSLSMSQRLILR